MEPSVVSNELSRLIQEDFLYEDMDTRFYGELGQDRKTEMAINKIKRRGRFAPYKDSSGQIIGYRLLEENGSVVLNNDGSAVEITFNRLIDTINEGRLTTESLEENKDRINAEINSLTSELDDIKAYIAEDPRVRVREATTTVRVREINSRLKDLNERKLNIESAQGRSTAPLDTGEEAKPKQADKGGDAEGNTTEWKKGFMRETDGINPDSIGIKSEEDAEDYLDLFRVTNDPNSFFIQEFNKLPNPGKIDPDLQDLSLEELRFEAKRLGIAGAFVDLENMETFEGYPYPDNPKRIGYQKGITKYRKHKDKLYKINLFGFKKL